MRAPQLRPQFVLAQKELQAKHDGSSNGLVRACLCSFKLAFVLPRTLTMCTTEVKQQLKVLNSNFNTSLYLKQIPVWLPV